VSECYYFEPVEYLLESSGIYFLESKFQHGERILDYLLLLEKGLASANFPDEGAPTQTSKQPDSLLLISVFRIRMFLGSRIRIRNFLMDLAPNPDPSIKSSTNDFYCSVTSQ
jgi:hypothetical protein